MERCVVEAHISSARVVVTVTDVTDTGLPYMKCTRRSGELQHKF